MVNLLTLFPSLAAKRKKKEIGELCETRDYLMLSQWG